MNNPNFTSILDRPSTEVERPKPMPVGTYLTVLQGQPRHDKSRQKQTPLVEFTHKFISAMDDVDEAELITYLTAKDGTTKALTDVTMKNIFYITEGSAFMLKDFLKNLDFDVEGDGSMRQMLDETPGRQVLVTIRHEASQDGQSVFARIGSTAKAD